jgi:hypothetical protein
MNIPDDELLLLDGRCSPETQTGIDAIKARRSVMASEKLTESEAQFLLEIVKEATKQKRLICQWKNTHRCLVCGKDAGYATHTRTTRWHRRGEPNYDRPLTFLTVELAERFVTIKNCVTLGCCRACWERLQQKVVEKLAGIDAEIAQGITGKPPQWKRFPVMKCLKCGWQGRKDEVIKLPALMQGYYPGECPECHAQYLPFGSTIFETLNEYALVPVIIKKADEGVRS